MYTTLNAIREHQPCKDGWETLLEYLGKTKPDDEPLSLLTVLESNGLNHALWCFRAVDGFKKEKLLLAITFAREVEHLMPDESKKAMEVFERCANGLATLEEFETARDAARGAAAHAARASWAAADASHAACAAADAAARAAAHDAVCAAVCAAADAAARAAAHDAWSTAANASYVDWMALHAAWSADSSIKAKQETQLRQLLDKTCTQP